MRQKVPILDAEGAATDWHVVANPGILFAYDILYAVSAARSLGNGVVVTTG
jgi:hypothetical protein